MSKRYRVIGLTGPKGSGKDTVGDILKTSYDGVQTIAFADPIKNVIQHIFNLNGGKNDYDSFKRVDLSCNLEDVTHSVPGRHVVREIGMLMRRYDEQQFNRYVREKIEKLPDTWWIVTDVRFDNEYIMLRELGATIIKIERPGYKYDGHITERGFDHHLVDYVINNDSTQLKLRQQVEEVFGIICKEQR